MYRVDRTFDVSDVWGELYIPSAEEQLLVHRIAVTQFCETVVLTASSSLSSATSSPFFILPCERVS
jgi:hypothetical protein